MGFNLSEETKPTTPSTGNVRLYNKSDELYVVKDDGSEEAVITGSQPSGTYTIIDKTSNYTILASEADDYTIMSNDGATSDITFQLPSATAGLRVYFFNVSDTYSIEITPGAGDTIKKNGTSFDTIFCNYQYDVISLVAINSTDWFVEYNVKPNNIIVGKLGGNNQNIIGFLDDSNHFWGWGENNRGMLLSNDSTYIPVKYDGLDFEVLKFGKEYALAIDTSGQAWQ